MGLPVTSRVLRGGSWNNNQNNARAVNRNNNNPNNRNNNNGFRVAVRSSHIFVPLHIGGSKHATVPAGEFLQAVHCSVRAFANAVGVAIGDEVLFK